MLTPTPLHIQLDLSVPPKHFAASMLLNSSRSVSCGGPQRQPCVCVSLNELLRGSRTGLVSPNTSRAAGLHRRVGLDEPRGLLPAQDSL